ncbi:unnamed protein product [Fusarium graminearum]|nr:unnamed protein product [Fusarium graminearum]CAG1959954.1 unnamed protein product [Fusarium graminearum]
MELASSRSNFIRDLIECVDQSPASSSLVFALISCDQNNLTERFDRTGMKFLPVRSEERLKGTLKERKFRISDERQIDPIVFMVINSQLWFTGTWILVRGSRGWQAGLSTQVALSSPETEAVLTGDPEGNATSCIASTVAVGKAGKGHNPRLNPKAKPVAGLRENVDWPIGEVNGQQAR